MSKEPRRNPLAPALLFAALLAVAFGTAGNAATTDQYVLLSPGPACAVDIFNIGVKSFRVLIPAARLQNLIGSTAIVSVHVCECALMGGDPEKCALDRVTKSARPVEISPDDVAALGGKMFVLIQDPDDFAKVYAALTSTYRSQTPNPAFRIMHDPRANGAAPPGGGSIPPSQPPAPPPSGSNASLTGPDQDKKKACEVSSSVCIDPKTLEASIEFEVNCDGLPPIVFSTDGKAGVKIGPLEISVSAGDRDKH